MLLTLLVWVAALLAAPVTHAASLSQSFYVAPAPQGAATGDGTARRPWDLPTALAGAGGRIQPGDTVWLTGGRYRGAFQTRLRGERDRLIVFRQERGARATIDGTLRAEGEYLAFWGFEIMQSNPVGGTYGLEARTNNGRFINLVIHDAGTMGVSFWTPGEDAELYGCIIYNNGTHENLDHGVYVHNERGIKRLVDNILFNNLAYGIHAYAGRGNRPQRGLLIMGNVAFNNGTISRRYRAKGNILVGGEVPFADVDVLSNYLFYTGSEGTNLRLGYAAEVVNENLNARQNLSRGGRSGGGDEDAFGQQVYVRANFYEPGRAYIIAYNASQRSELKADVREVLQPGDAYELRSVQDLFGEPLARGTYSGDSITLPMREPVSAPRPIGRPTAVPPSTRPAFDVFVLEARTGKRGAPAR